MNTPPPSTEPDAVRHDDPGERGRLVIAPRVIERIAAAAAAEASAGRGSDEGSRQPLRRAGTRATANVAGGRARVAVSVQSAWPMPLAAVATTVREHVRERVTSLTGYPVTAVDVTVAEMTSPQGEARRVQ